MVWLVVRVLLGALVLSRPGGMTRRFIGGAILPPGLRGLAVLAAPVIAAVEVLRSRRRDVR